MSEIDEKEIKRRFEVISHFEPSSKVTARDLERARERLTEHMSGQQTREQKIWRIIMKSKITKLAAAAVIIVAVLLSYFTVGVKETYAFEQTLEAFRDVRTIHLWGRNLRDNNFEMWIQLDPNTGMPDYCRLYTPSDKYLAVSRPEHSYQYLERINRVQITSGRLFSIEVAPAYMFEELIKFSKTENPDIKVNVNYEHDNESDKTLIIAIYETPIEKWKISIDPETKLPVCLNLLSDTHRRGLVFKDVDKIEYNVDLPEGIFDFEIPEGAQVIGQ